MIVVLVKMHAVRKTGDKVFYPGLSHQYDLWGPCGVGGPHHSSHPSEEAQGWASLFFLSNRSQPETLL